MLIFNLHHVEQTLRHPSRKHISITPEGLRGFIRTLRMVGMEIISMREMLAMPDPTVDSGRKVILTFDDGYENNLTEALPVLEEEACPATIFVLPGRFAGTNEWDQGYLPEPERDRLMSLAQIKQVTQSRYVTIGSHGMLHSHMPTLTPEEMAWEVETSYDILERELGDGFLPVFAYPWGEYSQPVVDVLTQSRYRYSFGVHTAQWQQLESPYEIPRYSVYYRDGNPVIFLAKLCRHGLIFA